MQKHPIGPLGLSEGPTRRGARGAAAALGALALSLPLLVAANPAAAGAAPALSGRLKTVMAVPRLISRSKLVGHVAGSTTIRGAVGLAPRNEAALQSFITSVTTAGSPDYHHYLRRGAFARRFGPSASTLAEVRTALSRAGLSVGRLSGNHLLVSFSGPASKVEAAFHTGLARYRLPDGKVGRATTRAVRLPASISSQVTVVAGLDNLVHPSAGIVRATKKTAAAHPAAKAAAVPHVAGAPSACSGAQQAASLYGGLTDSQIANSYGAYGLYSKGDTGQGQSIAIYELEPFAASDIHTFDQCYFGATAASAMQSRLHVVPVDGGQPSGYGQGEALLDVEDISAIAPGARIDVYEAPNTTYGSLDEYNKIVSNDSDRVVSTSWGLCESAVQTGEPGFQQEENAIFEQAAAQGQSIFAAAGDQGSDDCNAFQTGSPVSPVFSVDDPASQPYVTSVGGTTITNAAEPPSEQVWNDGALWGAGGGGVSNSWVMPSWQQASRVPGIDPTSTISNAESIATAYDTGGGPTTGNFCQSNSDGSTYGGNTLGEPCRELPDVSAQADEFTGAITVYSALFGPGPYGWGTIGGTSSAAPIWAALLADINASPTCQANGATTSGVGFVSPLLYAVASSPAAYAASFTDVKAGNNDIYDLANGATFPATTGYDLASGLGSPQVTSPNGGDGLAYYLCSYAVKATRPNITSMAPTTISTTAATPVTVSGSGFFSNGSSDVSAIWLNNILLPSASYSVVSDNTITLTAPPGSDLIPTGGVSDGAGPVDVTVSLTDGETSPINANTVLQAVDTSGSSTVPAVTGVSTYGGPQAGGNTVDILGSGFTGATAVTFGQVAATSFVIKNPNLIVATVPAYAAGTTVCATSPTLDPATDICQTQVVVTNANGSSQQYPILPTYEGATAFNLNGVIPATSTCGCEVAPAPSEYDYVPTPNITSVSSSTGPAYYASESGGTVITIHGSGFNLQTLTGIFFGPASQYSSEDPAYSYVSGTEIEVMAPPVAPTLNTKDVPVTIESLGGKSNSAQVAYGGNPQLYGVNQVAAPTAGGTTVTGRGSGLSGVAYAVLVDTMSPFSIGTAYDLSIGGNSTVSFKTPSLNAGIDQVLVCTVTNCSSPSPSDSIVVYPPGNPSITSSAFKSGPAHGGTPVTINGKNLGCVVGVWFGSTRALTFSNAQALLDCGSPTQVYALAPYGRAGTTVPIRVETVESLVTGYGKTKVTKAATFTYKESSPTAPRVYRCVPGGSSVKIFWRAPADDGGAPVRHYVIRASAKGFPSKAVILGPGVRKYTMKGLAPGVKWRIMITAHNAKGAGLSSVRFKTPIY